MSRIKIIRIITRMNVGGPSKHVINLTKGLEHYGFETHLISGQPSKDEGDMFEQAANKNIPVTIIRSMNRAISPLNDLISLIKIIKEIKKFSPDIIHTHTSKAGFLGRIAAMVCGVKQIYHTYHGHVFKGYFSKINTALVIAIERILSSFTTNLITLTPNQANEINRLIRPRNSHKIVTIPLGLDLNKNLTTPRNLNKWRTSMGFSQNDFVIGIIGRLVPIKNHELIIESMNQLCKTNPFIHLAIVGDGELTNKLRLKVKELNLENNIHFCGINKNVEEIYSDLDLLVLCSKNEGTPVVIIEALASGCPVASTKVGGVEEVLDFGRLGRLLSLEPDSFTQELTKAIKDIKENKFKEYPSLETRKYICNKFSVDKLNENIAKLYRRK